MKKIFAFFLIFVLTLTAFTSCSGDKSTVTSTNAETEFETPMTAETEKVITTLSSRNTAENLSISFDSQLLSVKESYTSEIKFVVNDEQSEYYEKTFALTFISDITAVEDYNASLGDASVVIKFSPLEKIVPTTGYLVYSFDESWYGEFNSRYFLYEKDSDLIKITVKEQISEEEIQYYLSLLEFKIG
jgi:hypothetical protein